MSPRSDAWGTAACASSGTSARRSRPISRLARRAKGWGRPSKPVRVSLFTRLLSHRWLRSSARRSGMPSFGGRRVYHNDGKETGAIEAGINRLALGYDRLVAVAIIALGAGTGTLASTVKPFATGVAADAAGVSISDGLGLRQAMCIVLVPISIGYVIWYGNRVRNDPVKSYVPTHLGRSRTHGRPSPRANSAYRRDIGFASGERRNRNASRRKRRGRGRNGSRPRCARLDEQGEVDHRHLLSNLCRHDLRIHPCGDVSGIAFNADFALPTLGHFYFTDASALFLVAAVITSRCHSPTRRAVPRRIDASQGGRRAARRPASEGDGESRSVSGPYSGRSPTRVTRSTRRYRPPWSGTA